MGGFFLILIIYFYFDESISDLKIIFLGMFILGFMSDKNILSNPKFRLIIQLFIISSLVLIENLKIEDLRILFLDQFLDNQYFNYFLTIFCIAILINGSNFIDGLNGLLSGYCILILFSFYML